MKKGLHPALHADAVITCITCSAVYKIPSTVKAVQVEVCSNCHPVYTGQYRGIMSSGRVDRFRKMTEASAKKKEEVKKIEEKRKAKPVKVVKEKKITVKKK